MWTLRFTIAGRGHPGRALEANTGNTEGKKRPAKTAKTERPAARVQHHTANTNHHRALPLLDQIRSDLSFS